MDAPAEGGPGKYVAPARRAGAVLSSAGMQQDQLPSIRVSNLPTDVKEEDLRDLFEQFGRIKKVYLGKDKKTGDFKVSYQIHLTNYPGWHGVPTI